MKSAAKGQGTRWTGELVLASASPRRKDLLARMGLSFTVDAGNSEEEQLPGLGPVALARSLSQRKARTVASRHRDAIVIAADTLISFRGRTLGKPQSENHAREMLRLLSGRSHRVITAFTIIDTATGREMARHVQTRVYFKRLSAREIDAYIATGEPLDKAGSYGIQGRGALFVKKIEGDYFNVVGLPVRAVAEGLRKFGIAVL